MEYMTTGRYLGEIVRLFLYEIASYNECADELPGFLTSHYSITTTSVAAAAGHHDVTNLAQPFTQLSHNSKAMIQPICKAVMDRSAALVAAYTVGLLAFTGDILLEDTSEDTTDTISEHVTESEELVIAYTGSLISSNVEYRQQCEYWINELMRRSSPENRRKQIVLKEAPDGGVIGAAVLAGTANVN